MPAPVVVQHAALQFARWWIEKERGYVSGIASGDRARQLAALRAAAGYFRVARNFPTAFDVGQGLERLAPALDALLAHSDEVVDQSNLPHAISVLRRALGDAYGGRDLLSAATKFLWILRQDPVVIFDSQARIALGAPAQDYEKYLSLWREGYNRIHDVLAEACTDQQVLSVLGTESAAATREWFHGRVYDIYLWNAGAPVRAT